MNVLNNDIKNKIKKFYNEKNYTKLENLLEKLENFDELPVSFLMIYAVSKALNPKSKISDYKISAHYFEKIYRNNEKNLEPLYNLIIVSLKAKRFLNLNNILENVYLSNKKDLKILEGLAKTNFFLGNLSKTTFFYKEMIKLKPNFIDGWTKFLGTINYHQNIDQKKYLDFCKEFDNAFIEKEKKLKFRKITNNEKINIGFVSPDFKSHSVSFFLRDILNKIDKNKFNIIAYSNLPISEQDFLSFELKKIFNHWIDIYSLNDHETRNIIINNKTDILVDLAGFTLGNRINLFKKRSAPVQLSWLGYCNSLGIKNMDYIIADKNLIKKDEKNFYTEKILYMPKIWNALSKPKDIPDINFRISRGEKFRFGSLNNFLKISDKTIMVWSKILNLTGSHLILKSSSNDSNDIKENLLNKFSKENVNLEKIEILDTLKSQRDHLECYNKFHLSLDTFPYPGVTTSFESLIMGKPVLTMKGNNFNSRCGESINLNVNLNEFIAENEDDYINKAVNFSKNPNIIENLNKDLREKILLSPLFDTRNFANDLEAIFLKIIR